MNDIYTYINIYIYIYLSDLESTIEYTFKIYTCTDKYTGYRLWSPHLSHNQTSINK